MTPKEAVKKLQKSRFSLREICFLLEARGIEVSYSTLSRIGSNSNYKPNADVANGLILIARKRT